MLLNNCKQNITSLTLLVGMTVVSLFYVQTWKFMYIHSGWSLAWILIKEWVKVHMHRKYMGWYISSTYKSWHLIFSLINVVSLPYGSRERHNEKISITNLSENINQKFQNSVITCVKTFIYWVAKSKFLYLIQATKWNKVYAISKPLCH